MTQGNRIKEAADSWVSAQGNRTAKDLCAKIGVTEQAFYKWVAGNTKTLKAENLMKFAVLTRFHPRYLLWGDQPKMLADDERFAKLMERASEMTPEEFLKLIDYADTLIRARLPKI